MPQYKLWLKRIAVFWMLIFLFYPSSAQIELRERLLIALLENDQARNTFKLDKHKDLPIVIIDVKDLFRGCILENIYEREVKVVNDTSTIAQKDASNIIIYNLSKKGGVYNIEIEQKYTGAYGNVKIRKRGQKIILTDFSVGYF